MLEKLDGRFLKTFLTVTEEGSFSRAADKLGYVQSTITSQIQQLEKDCGQQLFQRLPRGVKLTDAGAKLAIYARQFVQLSESLEEALGSLGEPRGKVRLRTLESFCVTRLSGFLSSFFGEYPEIKLLLETGFQTDIVEQVAAHAIDFGIVPKDPGLSDLQFEPLIEEEMVLVAAKDLAHLIQSKGWEQLTDVQIIGFGSRCVYQIDGQKLLEQLGMPINADLTELPSTELVRSLISCGQGVALVPEIMMSRELAEGSVVRLPMPSPIHMTHGLIWHKDRVLNTPSKAFREKLLAYFNQ